MGGVNVSISDEGEVKTNRPNKRLLVAFTYELKDIDESYSVEIKGKRYRISDQGETFQIEFDMALELM